MMEEEISADEVAPDEDSARPPSPTPSESVERSSLDLETEPDEAGDGATIPPPLRSPQRSTRRGLFFPSSFLSRKRTGGVSSATRSMIRSTHDVSTRANGIVRETLVEEVTQLEAGQVSARKRWKNAASMMSLRNVLGSPAQEGNEEGGEADEEAQQGETEAVKQYRLTTKRRYVGTKDCLSGQLFMSSTSENEMNENQIWSFNYYLTRYLHWTFRTSFFALFLVSLGFFYLLTLVFAGLFTLFAVFQPECLFVGEGIEFGQNGFGDAFHLSWTTFSTVGYGLTYPQVVNVRQCVLMNMFASFEAYVGVIFVGFVGALVFGKVARAQSRAKVQFSDPIVIRYGSGVMMGQGDDVSESSSLGRDQPDGQGARKSEVEDSLGIPCPVLEFRLINRSHQFEGGEIMNASISCSAVLEAASVAPSIRHAAYKSKHLRRRSKKRDGKHSNKGVFSLSTAGHLMGKLKQVATSPLGHSDVPDTIEEDEALDVTTYDFEHQRVTLLQKSAQHTAYDEDPSGKVVPRRIFSKMEIETPYHPLFRRVWHIRHVLNEKSPLLKAKAKRMITANGGSWPQELNSYEKVRESIYFERLLVSFSGTANSTANTVYAQKVYDFVNVNVGYRFSSILHISPQGKLEMDVLLLNDVNEQYGGGGEPFQNVQEDFVIPGQQVAEAVADVAQATGEAVDGALEKIQEVVGTKED